MTISNGLHLDQETLLRQDQVQDYYRLQLYRLVSSISSQ